MPKPKKAAPPKLLPTTDKVQEALARKEEMLRKEMIKNQLRAQELLQQKTGAAASVEALNQMGIEGLEREIEDLLQHEDPKGTVIFTEDRDGDEEEEEEYEEDDEQ